MHTYTDARYAYIYWSDGNFHAAEQFKKSAFFKNSSVDHGGPLALGFIDDPLYIQPMPLGYNIIKRDRFQIQDIEKIIEIYNRTGVSPISWYSQLIWDFIQKNYKSQKNTIILIILMISTSAEKSFLNM